MSVYFQACHLKLDQFTPAGFSSMLHSVARLGYYPGTSFMEDFEALVAPRLGRFTKGELWKLAHGLATLHYRPQDAFLTAYWEALAGQGRRLTVKDVSLVLWSFAVLDVGAQHAPALLALVETATELIARHQLDPQDDEFASRRGGDDPAVLKYRQLLQAAMYLRTLEAPLLNGAVQRLEDVLEEAWNRRMEVRAWAGRDADGTILGAVESEDGGDDGVRGHGGRGGAGERLGGQAQTVSPSSSSSEQSMTFPPRTASLPFSPPPPPSSTTLNSMTQPTLQASAMEVAEVLGLRVTSGTLNELFNLELLLYPWQHNEADEDLPVVLLFEGRGHFFTNDLGRFTGDAEFRRFIVQYHADRLHKFKAVAQITVWDWRNAKTPRKKLHLIRNVLRMRGLDPAVYIPPSAPIEKQGFSEGEGDVKDKILKGAGPVDGEVIHLRGHPEPQGGLHKGPDFQQQNTGGGSSRNALAPSTNI